MPPDFFTGLVLLALSLLENFQVTASPPNCNQIHPPLNGNIKFNKDRNTLTEITIISYEKRCNDYFGAYGGPTKGYCRHYPFPSNYEWDLPKEVTCKRTENFCEGFSPSSNNLVTINYDKSFVDNGLTLYPASTKATFACPPDYTLVVVNFSICNDRKWSNQLPQCVSTTCPDLGDIPGVLISYSPSFTNPKPRAPGSKATFACSDPNDTLIGPEEIICYSDRNWNNPPPVCGPKTCPDLGPLFGVRISYKREGGYLRSGSTASFECVYQEKTIMGPNKITCLADGNWDNQPPSCVSTTCPDLGDIAGVQISYSSSITNPEPRTPGSKANFVCTDPNDNLIGQGEIICYSDGNWNNPPPVCDPSMLNFKTCPELNEINGIKIVYERVSGYLRSGSTAAFECTDFTETVMGAKMITCQDDGNWDNQPPTVCEQIPCPDFGDIAGVQISYSNEARIVGTYAVFACTDQNDDLIGPRVTRCWYNGQWQSSAPTCVSRTTCQDLGDINGIQISYSTETHTVGSSANFQCTDPKENIIGPTTTTCQSNGKWDNQPPVCAICEEGWSLLRDDSESALICYKVLDESVDWTAAQSTACGQSRPGAILAEPRSFYQIFYIVDFLEQQGDLWNWIGIFDFGGVGKFIFASDGHLVGEFLWGEGKPSSTSGSEYCVALYGYEDKTEYKGKVLDCNSLGKPLCQYTVAP